MKVSLAAIISAMVLNACSVQQRYHRKGFNVNWNHTSIKVKNDKNKVTTYEESEIEEVVAKSNRTTNYSNEPIATTTSIDNQLDILSEEISNESLKSESENTENNSSLVFESVRENKQATVSSQTLNKKDVKEKVSKAKAEKSSKNSSDVPTVLLFILCFIIPPVAVGLATDWDITPVLWNVVWTLLCGFPGVIHAIIHVLRNR